ncbi:PiggyBac transposable element-derived protein 4, partial [Trichostrongylus colubriformis]
ENTWRNDAQEHERWTFSEPVGAAPEVDNCETPLQFYELFFSEELLTMIADQTNVYAQEKRRNWIQTDSDELRIFFGLCMQMSRCPFDNQRNYWSLKPRNLARNGHSIAGDFMTRDRFEEIQRHLHFVDNSAAEKTNKLYKVQPVLDYLNSRFQAMYRPERELCIDESMVPFRGRVSFWQYNGGKRHRFGIKLFKLCSRAGYTQKVKVYAGRDPKRTASVAEAVVLELMDGFLMQGRCLCTDNWYTSLPLAHTLLRKKTDMVGTIARNRKGIPQILRDKKLQRGEFIYQQNLKGVLVLKWRDKRDIHMMSTKHDAEHIDEEETVDKAMCHDLIMQPIATIEKYLITEHFSFEHMTLPSFVFYPTSCLGYITTFVTIQVLTIQLRQWMKPINGLHFHHQPSMLERSDSFMQQVKESVVKDGAPTHKAAYSSFHESRNISQQALDE